MLAPKQDRAHGTGLKTWAALEPEMESSCEVDTWHVSSPESDNTPKNSIDFSQESRTMGVSENKQFTLLFVQWITVTILDYFFSDIGKQLHSSKIDSSILSSILIVLVIWCEYAELLS